MIKNIIITPITMEQIKAYFEKNKENSFQRLDDNTCFDLNIDNLFTTIDYTYTPIGQQYLYNLLRNIPHESSFEKYESWHSHLENKDTEEFIEKTLLKLEDSDAYRICPLFQEEQPTIDNRTATLYNILQFLPFTSLLLCILLGSKIFLFLTIVFFITNMAIHYRNKNKSFLYVRSLPILLKMIKTADKLSQNKEIRELNPYISYDINELSEIKKRLSFFSLEPKLEGDAAIILWVICEIIKTFFLIEPVSFNRLQIIMQAKRDSVRRIFEFIGLVDTLQSVHKLRREYKCCIPVYSDSDSKLEGENIYHPIVENCIENSFSMNNRSFIIMGSNMSGKTTFTRTIAINVLVAQSLNTCFADKFTLSKFRLWSSMSINDSLSEGKSYYLAEVLRIKSIISETENGANLILLDELFKGTNTVERIAAAKAVLTYLASNHKNRVIAATHDIELHDLLSKSKFESMHFSDNIENNKLSFPYLLKHGSPDKRNAIKILELYNFPQEIVSDAFNTVNIQVS